jgi:hypothetical protein
VTTATGRVGRRLPAPRHDPYVAESLRRIALHQETAALLELRALQAAKVGDAELLRRRAADRGQLSQQLAADRAARPAS